MRLKAEQQFEALQAMICLVDLQEGASCPMLNGCLMQLKSWGSDVQMP